MSALYFAVGTISIALAIYLVYALIRAEEF
jgi:K+-transporting ATPase KdpF subunit